MQWVGDFCSLLFSPKVQLADIDAAFALKDQHLPGAIYQYRSCNPRQIENLERGTVWVRNPANFNDPFDCAVRFDPEALIRERWFDNIKPEVRAQWGITPEVERRAKEIGDPIKAMADHGVRQGLFTRERADRLVGAMQKVTDENFEALRNALFKLHHQGTLVSCFSTSRDSFRMWGHYAKKHTGFCVEFRPRGYGPGDLRTRLLYPVIYSARPFDITDMFRQMKESDWNNLQPIKAVLLKSLEWEYESEWRFAVTGEKSDRDQEWAFLPAAALYLGAKIEKSDRDRLCSIAKIKNIPVYRMTLAPLEYRLVAELIV